MRLNKYLAHSGICSRRQAVELIKSGKVTVNGTVVIEPYYLVQETDVVLYRDKPVKLEVKKVYILMNKPKDVITSVQDERGRKTVIDLLQNKVSERVYPVGRLDRDTTGLLLLTNDGDLAKKLSHPSSETRKFYQINLDKPLSPEDLQRIAKGLILEDGPIQVDGVDYVKGGTLQDIGIALHSGRNRVIRRIFEHLGYEVKRLDRTYFAGLTKKDLPRGFFRHLTEKEIIMLKHFT